MAYSHVRLRKTLAVLRILAGFVFLMAGQYKVSSLEFAEREFPQFLNDAVYGGAVGFYGRLLDTIVWQHTKSYAVTIGLLELFIGFGLVLGLAVRPISLIGMFYMLNLMLATWGHPVPGSSSWQYLQNELTPILLFIMFLLFAIGHAGENWGLGALYHRRRHLKWERDAAAEVEPVRGAAAEVEEPLEEEDTEGARVDMFGRTI